MELGVAGIVDEAQDIALLLPKGGVRGGNALDEATAVFGVGSVTGLATEHAAADRSLGEVVRRLDAARTCAKLLKRSDALWTFIRPTARPQPSNNPGVVEPATEALAFYEAIASRRAVSLQSGPGEIAGPEHGSRSAGLGTSRRFVT